MAKFAVGEIALMVDCYRGPEVQPSGESPVGQRVEIVGLCATGWNVPVLLPPPDYYIKYKGKQYGALESWLRKLPPDDHADTRDMSEDPGLTRLKKLLEQDTAKHKENVNV